MADSTKNKQQGNRRDRATGLEPLEAGLLALLTVAGGIALWAVFGNVDPGKAIIGGTFMAVVLTSFYEKASSALAEHVKK